MTKLHLKRFNSILSCPFLAFLISFLRALFYMSPCWLVLRLCYPLFTLLLCFVSYSLTLAIEYEFDLVGEKQLDSRLSFQTDNNLLVFFSTFSGYYCYPLCPLEKKFCFCARKMIFRLPFFLCVRLNWCLILHVFVLV